MNVENIKRVRDHIASLPPAKFDMQWLGNEPQRGCGSACCIAGWACRVLSLEGGPTSSAIAAFGLGSEDGYALFWPPTEDESGSGRSAAWEATIPQAVRVLDLLMETGEVHWDRALAEALA